MIILVDWHDVLQDYSNPFMQWYSDKYKYNLPSDANGKSFAELGLPAMDSDFSEFAKSGALGSLSNIDGAQDAIEKLSRNHYVVIVSASGYAVEYEKVLRDNFNVAAVIASTDKAKVADMVGAKYLIDDQVRNLVNLPLKCYPIAFAQSWNKNYNGFRGNWNQILKAFFE